MINFKQYLLELKKSFKKVSWNGNPKIGWWLDSDPITFYHGTHKNNLDLVEQNGILAPKEGSTANWISLALEPNTAFGYAAMSGLGGETAFRSAGKKVKSTPPKERIVFILEIPKKYVLKNMASERGAMQSTKGKLTDKSIYDSFSGADSQYYALTEIRLPKRIEQKYIKGYMIK